MMINFIEAVRNVMEEQGKEIERLFSSGIISKNTFWKYKQRNPSLQTLIKVANYLEVSIDYLFELTDKNDFKKYSIDQSKFYEKLTEMIKRENLSNREFCKRLNYQKDSINRYKHGVQPSLRTLVEISNFFRCTIDDLLSQI